MVGKFKYNGKDRNVVIFHESRDEKDNLIKFDGIDLSYLEPPEAEKCKAFFKGHEIKPFPQKGEKAEKIEGANSDWFKSYRQFLCSKLESKIDYSD